MLNCWHFFCRRGIPTHISSTTSFGTNVVQTIVPSGRGEAVKANTIQWLLEPSINIFTDPETNGK